MNNTITTKITDITNFHIGFVKWFGDKRSGKEYGFIEIPNYKDVYFNTKSVGDHSWIPQEGDIVVCKIKANGDKDRAIKVNCLDNISDFILLWELYSFNFKKDCRVIINCAEIIEKLGTLFESANQSSKDLNLLAQSLRTLLDSLSEELYLNWHRCHDLLNTLQAILGPHFQKMIMNIAENVSINTRVLLWYVDLYSYNNNMQEAISSLYWEAPPENKQIVLTKISAEKDGLGIVDQVALGIKSVHTDQDRSELLNFIKSIRRVLPNYNYETLIASNCSGTHLLWMWLNDYYHEIEIELISQNISSLDCESQQLIIKKIFYSIWKKQVNWSLNSLETLDASDLSSKLILKLFFNFNQIPKLSTMYLAELLLQVVESPEQICEVSGYFEECPGRTTDIKVDGSISGYHKIEKPRYVSFCEGRKTAARNQVNETEPSFWWCRNLPCFEAQQNKVDLEDWRKYTLRSFFEISGVKYNLDQYFSMLGMINRLNQYISHLKCTECGELLRPLKQSNWGFYRISLYHCINQQCSFGEKNTPIYISHCVNPYCHEIIDSRDGAAKCYHPTAPDGFMYICTNCYACCTTEAIQRRRKFLEKMSLKYNGPENGHKDMEQICCIKCGYPLQLEFKRENYLEVLQWLNNNKENNNIISKYGMRKDGGQWFLIRSSFFKNNKEFKEKLANLRSFGFEVPSFGEDRNLQLVGTIYKGIHNFKCARCGYTLDLLDLFHSENANQREKLLAIKKYHKSIESMFTKTGEKTK